MYSTGWCEREHKTQRELPMANFDPVFLLKLKIHCVFSIPPAAWLMRDNDDVCIQIKSTLHRAIVMLKPKPTGYVACPQLPSVSDSP